MIEWLDAYFYFIVYSVAGWLCEDVYVGIGKRKFVNRGFYTDRTVRSMAAGR